MENSINYSNFKKKKSKKSPPCSFIATNSSAVSWPNFTGKFNGNCVAVEDAESMSTLYFQGYFGKGSLSRSEPNFGINKVTATKCLLDASIETGKPTEDLTTTCNVHKVEEQLHLCLEEAFFLSYALGCLQVEHNETLLNLDQMWLLYCNTKEDFPPRYAAYHHYRTSGWVVRSGIKFSTDFLLYKQGPDFYHASYSVKVIPCTELNYRGKKDLSWIDFSGLDRITESASKELVLCHVELPEDATILSSPKCLELFKINESVWKRWVASQEREERKGTASFSLSDVK